VYKIPKTTKITIKISNKTDGTTGK